MTQGVNCKLNLIMATELASDLAKELFTEIKVDDERSELAAITDLAMVLCESNISPRDVLEQLYSLSLNACLVVNLGCIARFNREWHNLPTIDDLRARPPEQVRLELSADRVNELLVGDNPEDILNTFGVKNQKEADKLSDLQLFGRIKFATGLLLSLKIAEGMEDTGSTRGLVFESWHSYRKLASGLDESPQERIRGIIETADQKHSWEIRTLAQICLNDEDRVVVLPLPTATE